jgi:hypothetical protein
MNNQIRYVGQAECMRLAVKARVCVPTVVRALRGEFVRGDAGTRIRDVLAEAGLLPAPPTAPSTEAGAAA